jgi:sulfonate transport system permease protein
MFVGTLTAFSNVPQLYIDNARTLGASSFQIYNSVVLPAIFPELRSAILLSIGLSWTLVVASEFLGAQSGLGFIISSAYSFALLDRMFVVSLLLLIYAGISFAAFAIISKQFVKWLPES